MSRQHYKINTVLLHYITNLAKVIPDTTITHNEFLEDSVFFFNL